MLSVLIGLPDGTTKSYEAVTKVTVFVNRPHPKPFLTVEADGGVHFPVKASHYERTKGETCGHPGCGHHVTHPCERCGRKAGE